MDINEERNTKQNLQEIPLIFVFNRNSDEVNKFRYKDFLTEKHKFDPLYIENIPGFQNDNLIETNLVRKKWRKIQLDVEGVQELLTATLLLLKRDNCFDENDFKELTNLNDNIQNLKQNKNEQNLNILIEEYKNKCKKIKNYALFQKIILIDDKNFGDKLKEKRNSADRYLKWYIGGGFIAGMITIPVLNLPILFGLYLTVIYTIQSIYEIENITYYDILRIIFGIKTTFELAAPQSGKILESGASNIISKGIKKAQYGYLKLEGFQEYYSKAGEFLGYVFNPNIAKGEFTEVTEVVAKQIETHKSNLKYWMNLSNAFQGKYIRYVPVIGQIIGGFIDSYGIYKVGQNAIEFFEERLKEDNGYYSIIKRKKNIDLCFQYIDELSKQNWNEYIINEIKDDDN